MQDLKTFGMKKQLFIKRCGAHFCVVLVSVLLPHCQHSRPRLEGSTLGIAHCGAETSELGCAGARSDIPPGYLQPRTPGCQRHSRRYVRLPRQGQERRSQQKVCTVVLLLCTGCAILTLAVMVSGSTTTRGRISGRRCRGDASRLLVGVPCAGNQPDQTQTAEALWGPVQAMYMPGCQRSPNCV